MTFQDADYAVRPRILQKPNVVTTGFVMTRKITSHFHLIGTVADGITVGIHYADNILNLAMEENGRIVKNVKKLMVLKFTRIQGQMNTISKDLRTRPAMNQRDVQSVIVLLF